MPDYRRAYTPGEAIFLTLVTFNRRQIFAKPDNVKHLRKAIATVKAEMPFDITAAVVLPDHIHFMLTLPQEDDNYSKRVGRLKVLLTRSLKGKRALPQNVCISRQRQRESDVWQRRFWEHTIRDEADWVGHVNYLRYNPVNSLDTFPDKR
jgi:putative transposase